MHYYSQCCGAIVRQYPDYDYCSDCKEHCGDRVLCDCEMEGGKYPCDADTCECSEKCNFCYPDKVQ